MSSVLGSAWPGAPFATAAQESPEEATEEEEDDEDDDEEEEEEEKEEEETPPDFRVAGPEERRGVLGLFPWGSAVPHERHTQRLVQL